MDQTGIFHYELNFLKPSFNPPISLKQKAHRYPAFKKWFSFKSVQLWFSCNNQTSLSYKFVIKFVCNKGHVFIRCKWTKLFLELWYKHNGFCYGLYSFVCDLSNPFTPERKLKGQNRIRWTFLIIRSGKDTVLNLRFS